MQNAKWRGGGCGGYLKFEGNFAAISPKPSPLKGEGLRAGEDTRPYGGYRSRPFLTLGPDTGRPADVRGASRRPRPAVQHQSHLLGILRRRCGTATAAIFPIPGPSGPAGI